MKINEVVDYLNDIGSSTREEEEEFYVLAYTRSDFETMLSNYRQLPTEITDEGWEAIIKFYLPSLRPRDIIEAMEDVKTHNRSDSPYMVTL